MTLDDPETAADYLQIAKARVRFLDEYVTSMVEMTVIPRKRSRALSDLSHAALREIERAEEALEAASEPEVRSFSPKAQCHQCGTVAAYESLVAVRNDPGAPLVCPDCGGDAFVPLRDGGDDA